MKMYARFTDAKGNDEIGSDSVVPLDARLGKAKAIEQVRSARLRLRIVRPGFSMFEIRKVTDEKSPYSKYNIIYRGV